MKTVTVRFGVETATRSFPDEATVAQVVSDHGIRAELGYGDSIRSLVNGVEQSNSVAPGGGTIVVETRANSKARVQ